MKRSTLRPLAFLTVLFGVLFGAFNNCDIQRPAVDDLSYASVGYTHTGQEVSCAGCHESDRPVVTAAQVIHGNGADCVACHSSTNAPVGTTAAVWTGLQVPYTHTAGLTSCVNCHSPNEPAPVNGFVHYANNDCVSCHTPNSDTNGLTQAQISNFFVTSYAYTHPTGIPKCAVCHEKDRFNAAHNPGLDCVSCHLTNDTWNSTLTLTQIQAIWNTSR